MCTAVTMALASFGMNAASAVASHNGDAESAKTTNLSNQLNRFAAADQFARRDAALGKDQRREMDAASAKKADVALEARKAAATNEVAAGEAGISGPTVDSLMRDIYAQQGRYEQRVDTNLDWSLANLQDQKAEAGYQMKDRINSLRDVRAPSPAFAALKVGAASLDAASSYKTNKKAWGE